MARLSRLAVTSLVVGLVAAAFVLPWALSNINKAAEHLRTQQELLAPATVPVSETRAVAQKAVQEQAVQTKVEPDKVVVAPVSEPSQPALSYVPQGSLELVPLEGWIDQPDKSRTGRLHTNLMVRWSATTAKPRVAARAPCLKKMNWPAERIERPYGWIEVPARTILVACSELES